MHLLTHIRRSALTSDEKSAYIQADLCLMAAPAKSGIPGAITRWDELQYSHIAQASYIHGVVGIVFLMQTDMVANVVRALSCLFIGTI